MRCELSLEGREGSANQKEMAEGSPGAGTAGRGQPKEAAHRPEPTNTFSRPDLDLAPSPHCFSGSQGRPERSRSPLELVVSTWPSCSAPSGRRLRASLFLQEPSRENSTERKSRARGEMSLVHALAFPRKGASATSPGTRLGVAVTSAQQAPEDMPSRRRDGHGSRSKAAAEAGHQLCF